MGKAIIRMGDQTSHGGVISEGFPDFIVCGAPAAGVGHTGYCPQCKTQFQILSAGLTASCLGKEIAVEGMTTSCGATLIATQQQATVDVYSEQKNDAQMEQNWFALEDESGNPIEGYCYDLHKDGELFVNNGSYNNGKTAIVDGNSNLDYVMRLAQDPAGRYE